ncbi:MAG: TetR/AcrR family transcriptional regulator [Pseudomonadota bacterium]|nr:TetR/AcrR family transcriptional regulator [Pseudomonadota bacterium]
MSVSHTSLKPARASAAVPRTPHKGRQTKAAIVEAALGLATQIGLEGLSIGALAEVMQMSKSGVFAHFGSREELQISVVRHYHARFEEEVFFPALQQPRGLARLQAMFHHWMQRTSVELDSGCIYISGAVEFDDRPGPVRDALAGSVQNWLAAMKRAVVQARQAGHLQPEADEHQIAFEIHGLILALHYEARFLKIPGAMARAQTGFASILARHAPAGMPTTPEPEPEPVALGARSSPRRQAAKKTAPQPSDSQPV